MRRVCWVFRGQQAGPEEASDAVYDGGTAAESRATEVRPAPTLAMLRARRAEILRLASERSVSNIRVFGSVAGGDATPDSDIDLLVDFEVRNSGLDLVASEMELESLLGYRVEAGTSIEAGIRDRVELQAVPL